MFHTESKPLRTLISPRPRAKSSLSPGHCKAVDGHQIIVLGDSIVQRTAKCCKRDRSWRSRNLSASLSYAALFPHFHPDLRRTAEIRLDIGLCGVHFQLATFPT